MRRFYFFILSIIVLSSCEKDINFKLDETSPKIVVEAEIENGKFPRVLLTRSQAFFSSISPELLANAFVRNAEVYMSNGAVTHRLKEYNFVIAPGLNGYYYSMDDSDPATVFQGELNKTYKLKIIADGKEYNSTTSIPALTKIPDSVYFMPVPDNPDPEKRNMFAKFTDPKGLGNYVRYFTKKNNEPFWPPFNSVFTDEVIDGTTYTIQVPQGVDRNNLPDNPFENYYNKGDVVTLKFCNIDRPTYIFWNTWEFSIQTIGNPFAQPGTVIGNISNGALGSFCGYAAWYKTLEVN